jgi:RNA 3'-terminal phosphate cyclase (ATP)
METVSIDGSLGEGGGQILRTSLALSCITGKALHMENIRANRRNPGLAKQHISCVYAVRDITSGICSGVELGSQILDFQPGKIQGGNFSSDIGSAGSASLVIQTIMPPLFLADKSSTVTVTGGTHNPMSPPYDFFERTFLPAIATGGFNAKCRLLKHGFFPAGGGKIKIDVQPWDKESSSTIDFCQPAEKFEISAIVCTAKLPSHIADRQRGLLLRSPLAYQGDEKMRLSQPLKFETIELVDVTDSDGPGNCVMILLSGEHRETVLSAFGEKGKPSEKVIREAVNLTTEFLKSAAAIAHFLADQLLIYMAMTRTGSFATDKLSSHLQTNIEVIKRFLPVDFAIEQQKTAFKISCCPPHPAN